MDKLFITSYTISGALRKPNDNDLQYIFVLHEICEYITLVLTKNGEF